MEKTNTVKQYVSILAAMVFFALSFIWFKIANVSYGPFTIVFIRLAIASATLYPFAKISKRLVIPDKRDLKFILLLAFFEPFLYFMGESFGLQYISSTVASVIVATIPLVAPFAGYIFYREKVSFRNIAGILISFLGVLVVIYEIGSGITASPTGIALQFVAVLSAVFYTIVLNKISPKMNNLSVILFQNTFGAIYFLPFWLVFEMKRFLSTPPDPHGLVAIVELALLASSLAFIFFTYSVRHMGIFRSNMFINAIPVFTAFFAWIFLGDGLNLQKIIGIVVVIAGLFLAQFNRKKQRHGPDPIPFD